MYAMAAGGGCNLEDIIRLQEPTFLPSIICLVKFYLEYTRNKCEETYMNISRHLIVIYRHKICTFIYLTRLLESISLARVRELFVQPATRRHRPSNLFHQMSVSCINKSGLKRSI